MDKKVGIINLNQEAYKVRQDRYSVGLGSLYLVINEENCKVANYSLFGVAYNSDKNFSIGDFINGQLYYSDTKIIDLHLEIKRKDNFEKSNTFGCEIVNGIFPVDEILHIVTSYNMLLSVDEKYNRYKSIKEEIKFYIDDLYIWLNEVQGQVDKYSSVKYENMDKKQIADSSTIKIIGNAIAQKLKFNNTALGELVMKEEDRKNIFEYYRYRLGKFIFQSPFTNRSYSKPLGYAGDYEMMNIIYRSDNFANSLFGSCMEHAVGLHEEPAAVRNRIKYISNKIISLSLNKGPSEILNVLSVACGPAEEIKFIIDTMNQDQLNRVNITLLDQDENALKYAQFNIKKHLLETKKELMVNVLKKDIREVITSGLDNQYDLIYSAGLFDYFSDPVASRTAKRLFDALLPNGKLIVGNFNIDSPNIFGMLALFDWHLILRGPEELKRIYSMSNSACSVEAEDKNVNLFCIISKV